MKNFLFVCTAAILLSSCYTKRIAPPYTKVESIIKINPGMTASEVSSTLGIPPFDIYHMSGDGSTVHMYYYKVKERRNKECFIIIGIDKIFSADAFYAKEQNLTVGSSYYTKEERLYVLFKNGKVSSLVTDAGRDDSEDLLVQNNTIQFISKTDRNALMYEKLELGQQLIRLDHKGSFETTGNQSSMFGEKTKKSGCMKGGCMGFGKKK